VSSELGRAFSRLPARRVGTMMAAVALVAGAGMMTAGAALASTTSPLAVVTTYLPAATAQTSYSDQLAAVGGTKPYSWSVAGGALPTGLTLKANGTISGKPGQSGTFDFTAEVTDADAATATASESITVTAPSLTVTTNSLPDATEGAAYSEKLAATGGITPYTWTLSGGALPTGLTLKTNGTISGTPKEGGMFDFTAEVADSDNPYSTATADLFLRVEVAPLTITTASSLPAATAGAAYSVTLAASGGVAPYTWSLISGSLPAGVKLKSNGTIKGVVPTVDGTYDFTVQVSDAESPAANVTGDFKLVIEGGWDVISNNPA
jgi:hypothetical protein